MSSDSHSSSHRGRRRRGGQRRNWSDRQSGGDRPAPKAPAAAPSLWQRIVSFFSGSKSKPTTPASAAPRNGTSHPAYGHNNGSNVPPSAAPERRNGPPPARFSHKPEVVDVTTPRLYVGNLSFDATDEDLAELFKGVGKVATAEVVTHRHTERSKGFAFVQMMTVDEARRAVAELHDRPFMGRPLVVSGAKALEQREAA